jgi:chromosome segregation ATPase
MSAPQQQTDRAPRDDSHGEVFREELRIRILYPDGRTRLARLGSKCTIGSSPSCSIRLSGPEMQSVHCLIVYGVRRTVVRNLSPGNTLNGGSFTDAVLTAGDRLRIGRYELQLLAATARRRQKSARRAASPSSLDLAAAIESRMNRLEGQLFELQREQTVDKITGLRQTIKQLQKTIERQRKRHFRERKQWRNEQHQLVARLELNSAQVEQLSHETTHVQQQQLDAVNDSEKDAQTLNHELQELNQALVEAREQQQVREAAWLQEKTELEKQFTIALDRVVDLESEVNLIRTESTDASLVRADYEASTSELGTELEQLNTQLLKTQAAHENDRQTWTHERHELEQRLEQTQEQLAEVTGPFPIYGNDDSNLAANGI